MRTAPGQRREELLRAGHPTNRSADGCRPSSCTTLDSYVRNRRLRRASSCPRRRRRRAAPDGVPRLRLVRHRAARRARRPDGAPSRRPAGQPGGRARRDGRRQRWPAPPGWATPAGPPTAAPPTATRTRTATPRARSPSSTTASSRTSPPLRPELEAAGVEFASDTDTEVAVHLVAQAVPPRRRPPAISRHRCWPCCAGWRATSPWSSPTPTSPAPSSPPAARRRWWSVSATARCSSAPTSPRSSSTPATPSNSARTRRW